MKFWCHLLAQLNIADQYSMYKLILYIHILDKWVKQNEENIFSPLRIILNVAK